MKNPSLKKNFKILAIDTSCDETSVAVTMNDRVLSNVISSQIKFHQKYGGVVPNIARRMHQEFIGPAIEQALKKSGKPDKAIDAIAVTAGPGLAPALEIGILKAKELAKKYDLKTFVPFSKKLLTDNAAMVGVCGWYQAKRGDFVQDIVNLDRQPNLNF